MIIEAIEMPDDETPVLTENENGAFGARITSTNPCFSASSTASETCWGSRPSASTKVVPRNMSFPIPVGSMFAAMYRSTAAVSSWTSMVVVSWR